MIFSGEESNDLWKRINQIHKKRKRKTLAEAVETALYVLACRCQTLESEVEHLKKKVDKSK